MGEKVISTTRGWIGLSRQRWDEVRLVDPWGRGREDTRPRKDVMQRGDT